MVILVFVLIDAVDGFTTTDTVEKSLATIEFMLEGNLSTIAMLMTLAYKL